MHILTVQHIHTVMHAHQCIHIDTTYILQRVWIQKTETGHVARE